MAFADNPATAAGRKALAKARGYVEELYEEMHERD